MTTTPADLPDSIEDLRVLVLLQAEKHEEEKHQLELKVSEQEQAIAKQEQTVSEYSEEISSASRVRPLAQEPALRPEERAKRYRAAGPVQRSRGRCG